MSLDIEKAPLLIHQTDLLDSIKSCGRQKDLHKARGLHSFLLQHGLLVKRDTRISNALLSMYGKCGSLLDAKKVFEDLPMKDVVSWNALLSGYAQHGFFDQTLEWFRHMKDESISPDSVTFNCVLKACGNLGFIEMGEEIYGEVKKQGLLNRNVFLCTTIVDMYAKCGMLEKAQRVFDDEIIVQHDIIAWNALIGGYAQHRYGYEALRVFKQMQEQGVLPDVVTIVCILKACGSVESLKIGEEIYSVVIKQGLLEANIILGNALVDMYGKCGVLGKAQDVFEKLQVRNIVSWNILISGYVQHGLFHEALNCFKQVQNQGLSPNSVTFVCILKACGCIRLLELGEEIHADVRKLGLLENDALLGNALIDMYARCGVVDKAQRVFEEIRVKDIVSWNSLITGYVQHGLNDDALKCFKQMQDENVSPDVITFTCILKACSNISCIQIGEAIHTEVHEQGLLEKEVVLGTALVDMYGKCGAMEKAQKLFEKLKVQNVASWNALISGYAQHGSSHAALKCFHEMQDQGVFPDVVTFMCVLKACGNIGLVEFAEEIHSVLSKQGILEKHIVVGTTLVDTYAKCGALEKAQEVFNGLQTRDLIAWNALISGYVQHGQCVDALKLFKHMQDDGIIPDIVSFISILKACGDIRSLTTGEEIHVEIIERMLLETDVSLGNALVDMYAKCGVMRKAKEVFESLPVRNALTWTALIYGYIQLGLSEEALCCFRKMQDECIFDVAILIGISKACTSIGCIGMGEEIALEVCKQGLLGKELMLGTTLVDMYAKCGMLRKAQEVFEKLPLRDEVSWNVLMAGYAQLGESKQVLNLFRAMRLEGNMPDLVTFLVLLNACNHGGLVEEGILVFDHMINVYHLNPTLEHYTCIVDLLSRAGHFDKAGAVIDLVPSYNCLQLWLSILGACCKLVNLELGIWAFEQSIKLDQQCVVAYVYLGNIYATASIRAI